MATITIKKDPNYREVPFGGNDGDILKKVGDTTSDRYEWTKPSNAIDYESIENKPSINGVQLVGDRSLAELGIDTITAEYVQSRYDEIMPKAIEDDDWKIDYNTQVKNHPEINGIELIGDRSIQEVILKETNSEEISTLKVDGIFVYVGQVPPTSFVKELNVLNSRGFIEVDKRFETSVKGLFAIGDCIDKECRQIASAVGDAATALHFIED